MHAADYGSSNPVGSSAAASWGGFGSSETADALVTEAASLYSDAAQWARCQQTGECAMGNGAVATDDVAEAGLQAVVEKILQWRFRTQVRGDWHDVTSVCHPGFELLRQCFDREARLQAVEVRAAGCVALQLMVHEQLSMSKGAGSLLH